MIQSVSIKVIKLHQSWKSKMSVSLKLILFFSLLSFLEAKRLKALEVKNVYCKDCQKLESGMIQNYFLSDYTNMSRNELTDIYNKVQLEPQSRKNYVSKYFIVLYYCYNIILLLLSLSLTFYTQSLSMLPGKTSL